MTFSKGDLVVFDRWYERAEEVTKRTVFGEPKHVIKDKPFISPRARPTKRVVKRMITTAKPVLHRGDIGVIVDVLEGDKAWLNYDNFPSFEQEELPVLYEVYWQKRGVKYAHFPDEVKDGKIQEG